jgi:hypothetical protein
MNIPAPSGSQGTIPAIEDGLYVVQFNDIEVRIVDQFKAEKNAFGKTDDGTCYDFMATVLDEDRQPVLKEDAESPDDTLDLKQAKRVPVFSSHEKSNSYFYLKGILTATEMRLFEAAGKGDEEADEAWAAAAQKVNGRHLNAQVTHNEKGWPQIEAFLGPAKAKGK